MTVNAVAQTTDGYLWFGTFGGLVRFDGVSMRTFSVRSHPVLASDRITALLGAKDGALWVGTQYGGIYRYENDRFEFVGLGNGDFTREFSEGPDGAIWIANGELSRWKSGQLRKIELGVSGDVNCVMAEEAGGVWCGGNAGLLHYDNSGQVITVNEVQDIIQLLPAEKQSVWAVGPEIYLVDPDGTLTEFPIQDRPTGPLRTAESRTGDTWMGGTNGLFVWPGGVLPGHGAPGSIRVVPVTEAGTPSFTPGIRGVTSMLEDREGNLWIGTARSGVFRVWVDDSIEEITTGRPLKSCVGFGDGAFLVANGASWIRRLDPNGRLEAVELNNGVDESWITSLFVDRNARYWMLRGSGAYILKTDQAIRISEGNCGSGLVTADGHVWLGGQDGISEYGETGLVKHLPGMQPKGLLRPIAERSDGALWLIDDRNLYSFRDSKIEASYKLPSSARVRIRDYELDRDETLWLSSYGQGLYRFRAGRFDSVGSSLGLSDDYLGHIFSEADGNLWINSNRGVFVVSVGDLNACIDGELRQVDCRLIGTPEGNGGQGYRSGDGQLWFPTINGLIGVRPDRRTNPLPPPVYIDAINWDGKPLELADEVVAPPGAGSLELKFSVLSYSDPLRVQSKYRLQGLSEEWIDIGARRAVYFTNLRPGKYEFELIARNSDGVWNSQGVKKSIYLQPHYYQTWWFYLLSSGTLIACVVGLHHWRVARVEGHNHALNQEIDSRRRMEAALRESEAKYRAVAETAMDGIVVVNRDRSLEYANEAAERMFGFEFKRGDGLRIDRLLQRSEVEADAKLELNLFDLENEASIELIGRDASQRAFPVELSSGRLERTPDDYAVVCIIRDVSKRKSLERQLADRNRLEAIGRLTGGIAHDFNNILTAMVGYVEMLAEDIEAGVPSPELREHLLQIHLGNERATNLVRDLMTFARQRVVKRISLDPNRVIQSLVPMLERLIPATVSFKLELDETVGCISIDAHQLEQIVVNLVLNGKDAIEGKGTVSIATRLVDQAGHQSVEIRVSDDGCGMHSDDFSKIFDPFYTTKSVGKGTGMGLASVHGIVQQLGVSIEVDSSPGNGATFSVFFPAVNPLGGKPSQAPTSIDRGAQGETILLCDDDASAREVANLCLKRWGYTVLEADGAAQAIELIEAYADPIHVLLTDVVMPDMNGPALAEVVRKKRPEIKVLYVSGYVADVSLESKLKQSDAFLEKPFSPSDLSIALFNLLNASA